MGRFEIQVKRQDQQGSQIGIRTGVLGKGTSPKCEFLLVLFTLPNFYSLASHLNSKLQIWKFRWNINMGSNLVSTM